MFLQIRNAIMEEAKINPNFITQNVNLDSYLLKIEEHAMFHSAFTKDSLYGFIAFYANDLNYYQGFISMVHVAPGYRGKGIAKTLISATCQTMKSLEMKSCALEVLCSNQNAINLYKSLGFKINEERSDILYMIKDLETEV